VPAQKGGPLNYFVYPYVELDGKKWENIANDFSFADLEMVRAAKESLLKP
jgi:hypothetical protein